MFGCTRKPSRCLKNEGRRQTLLSDGCRPLLALFLSSWLENEVLGAVDHRIWMRLSCGMGYETPRFHKGSSASGYLRDSRS